MYVRDLSFVNSGNLPKESEVMVEESDLSFEASQAIQDILVNSTKPINSRNCLTSHQNIHQNKGTEKFLLNPN